MNARGLTFPLVSRRRLVGLAFGAMHGARRGTGSDIAASRPYRPGDNPDRIDWGASARLSSARNTDEFVVREYFADEAPRAIVAVDCRSAMSLCPPGIPWLQKGEASRAAAELVEDSVAEARGFVGRLEFGAHADVVAWSPPAGARGVGTLVDHALPDPGSVSRVGLVGGALDYLAYHRRSVPAASFVFVVSDFLAAPALETWERALDRGWDIVPVIVQDPVWEQSFPDVDGIGMPLADNDGRLRIVRLRRGESQVWRARHEARLATLLTGMRSLGIEPVVVSSADPSRIFDTFVTWSAEREGAGRQGR
ncbi:DUF58 domain-containing protein [Gaiella sp.]|uniref:DUF58 domain-containing protein n=1 Tax=Gaiella sp. TaxID=2663207 RepID=UPI003267DD72